ncbi:hypothetical protein [Bosea psychrotolerans]|uniref:Uncharacterized protein n=1 Tax=Bosea psychrotolerans TaxID=1871628 RepID=A0A2S4M1K0_9HYPH|nr:hypothetical protein [Bosea psychrotolerans]POR48592.1 hypothetical protein CYD53_11424 [Bosea psychrotolerans]
MGLALGNRNVGLVWSALGTGAAPSISLFFAATQLPIYLLLLLIEWIVRVRRSSLAKETQHADRTP